MVSVIDEIIMDVSNIYRKLSLLELLAEENMMAKFWHNKKLDITRKKLQEMLRSAIEEKLR